MNSFLAGVSSESPAAFQPLDGDRRGITPGHETLAVLPKCDPDRASTSANTNQDEVDQSFKDVWRDIEKEFPNSKDKLFTILANADWESSYMLFGHKITEKLKTLIKTADKGGSQGVRLLSSTTFNTLSWLMPIHNEIRELFRDNVKKVPNWEYRVYEAAANGDWMSLELTFGPDFTREVKAILGASITPNFKTTLNLALRSSEETISFVKESVKCLSTQDLAVTGINYSTPFAIDQARPYETLLIKAAEKGLIKVATDVKNSFPSSLYTDCVKHKLFVAALINGHEEFCEKTLPVYNGDTIVHKAARLPPEDSGDGAAMIMQSHAHFFEGIKRRYPHLRNKLNNECKTADQVFNETNQSLIKDAEKSLTAPARSLITVALFIAAIAFAAAVTVPGGTSGNGKPNLRSETAFRVFVAADALTLFSSCVSIFMLLSILTSEYSRPLLRRGLPMKFIIGHLALFVSVSSMTASFTSALYLIFGKEASWILAPSIVSSWLIIFVFGFTQVPLFVKMMRLVLKKSEPNSLGSRRGLMSKILGKIGWRKESRVADGGCPV